MAGGDAIQAPGAQCLEAGQSDMAPEGGNDDVETTKAAARGHCAGAGAEDEVGASGEDLRACLFQLLQQKSPGQRITCHALDMLEGVLNTILQRVLTEAVKSTDEEGPEHPGCVPAAEPLTSLDIQRALKTSIPNAQLRPCLPAETKRCWHLDKKSLPGMSKRRKLAAAAAAEQHAMPVLERVAASDTDRKQGQCE